MDSLQKDEDSGPPHFETDDDDQESGNVIPQFEVLALLNLCTTSTL
jgi:hypothetical protein